MSDHLLCPQIWRTVVDGPQMSGRSWPLQESPHAMRSRHSRQDYTFPVRPEELDSISLSLAWRLTRNARHRHCGRPATGTRRSNAGQARRARSQTVAQLRRMAPVNPLQPARRLACCPGQLTNGTALLGGTRHGQFDVATVVEIGDLHVVGETEQPAIAAGPIFAPAADDKLGTAALSDGTD